MKKQLQTGEYAEYLSAPDLTYTYHGPYLVVGGLNVEDGWIACISVVRQEMDKLMGRLTDFLFQEKLSFMIPRNAGYHREILDGRQGFMMIGKIICISISNRELANPVIVNLVKITEGFKGPSILSAVPLSSNLSVYYGNLLSAQDLNRTYYSPIYGYRAAEALTARLKDSRIQWPFAGFAAFRQKRAARLVKNQYLPVQSLKNDAKGSVLKCIKLNWVLNSHWCVLKQGKQYQCFDDAERDAKDRIRWQYQLHRCKEGRIPLPKAMDYFEQEQNAFLVLEYIEGVSLTNKTVDLQNGIIWLALETQIKQEIIGYLLQVTDVLGAFHREGLVHRDVTPGNFMVAQNGKVVAIDIELCYDVNEGFPSPPFHFGTEGYMSPQQLKNATPVFEDDLYALGALFIKTFTGLLPNKFATERQEHLYDQMLYFLGSHQIAALICNCLSPDASSRPGLNAIRNALAVYNLYLLTLNCCKTGRAMTFNKECKITSAIQKAVNGLVLVVMTGRDKERGSASNETVDLSGNDCSYAGLGSGTEGILFTLSKAKALGYHTPALNKIISRYQNALEKVVENSQQSKPGLFQGSYGIAIAFYASAFSCPAGKKPRYRDRVDALLSIETKALNLANGMAGQGLCLLYTMSEPGIPSVHGEPPRIVSVLIGRQEKDGSWLIKRNERDSTGVKLTGFAYGIAGIAYFLLEYYALFKNTEIKKAITKSLAWLIAQRKFVNGAYLWWVNPTNATIDPWLEHGFSGIALTFIKAYEVLQDPFYKEVATSALLSHPRYIASNYFSIANGLSGLGEVYLEAAKIFKEHEWQLRADHIANFLINACKVSADSSLYWIDADHTKPAAGLMYGNSGIVYFLMRHLHPEKIPFPFLLN